MPDVEPARRSADRTSEWAVGGHGGGSDAGLAMRVEYDQNADAVYVWLRGLPYAHGKDLDKSRRVDYAADHRPIGIELLDVSAGSTCAAYPIPRRSPKP